MSDPREEVGVRLWNRGFGHDPSVNVPDLDSYLEGIPQIPASLLAEDSALPLLSLADPRPGLLRACRLLGIQHEELGYKDGDAVPFDDRFTISTAPFWFRHDDGRRHRNRRPDCCRFKRMDIQAGTALEGVFLHVHHPGIVREGEYVINLPGTVNGVSGTRYRRSDRTDRAYCASLEVWHGETVLSLSAYSDIAHPCYGALRVRRK